MSINPQIVLQHAKCAFHSSRLVRNVGWMTAAEMVSRLGRIVTAIVLARSMDMAAFGVAALAITIFELMRIFTENGIGAAVIRSSEEKLAAVANSAYRMMWVVCGSLFAAQIMIGIGALYWFPDTNIGWMVCALAGVYLAMPFGLVHAYMLLREERMKRMALVASSQTLADHLLTALLALSGFGAWSIVLPKILTTPIWLIGVTYNKPWQRNRSAGTYPVREILHFCVPILLSELAIAAREQLDKVLVSTLFGIEALGLYYFAFNAGLGLSTALNRALTSALYPFLCTARSDECPLENKFRRALLLAGLPLTGVYCAQALAALLYVPVLFGADWRHAAPLVALLCLGGPARLLADSVRIYWRSLGHSKRELKVSFVLALGILLPIPLLASAGLIFACIGSVIGGTAASVALTLPILAEPAAQTPPTSKGALA